MNRIFVPSLALSLFLISSSHAQTNTDAGQSMARIDAPHEAGAMHGETQSQTAGSTLPKFSGNIPGSVNEDRIHGVNAPGTLIGPSPDNGQPDPRFSGGVSAAQSGAGQVGGSSSDINEGLPAASANNSGANSGGASGGTGGGAGGTEVNAGGDARLGKSGDEAQGSSGTSDVGRETRGASPYPIIAGVVILGAFLFSVIRSRGMR